MNSMRWKQWTVTMAVAAAFAMPLAAHHSFSAFDQTKTRVFTGVVTRVNPDANHLQIYFAPMNDERKNVQRDDSNQPLIWEVELQGSAAAAAEGVTVDSFKPGTVISVGLHPMRNGDPKGLREGPLFKCPFGANGKAMPPKANQHCDMVQGSATIGQGKLATPTP